MHILRAEREQGKGESIPTASIFFQKEKLASPGLCSPITHRLFTIRSVVLLCDLKSVCTLSKQGVSYQTKTIVLPKVFLFSQRSGGKDPHACCWPTNAELDKGIWELFLCTARKMTKEIRDVNQCFLHFLLADPSN